MEATHPNPGLHGPEESSADTHKARCVCAPCPKVSGIRRKQTCIRNPDGVSCLIMKNLILALLTPDLERCKPRDEANQTWKRQRYPHSHLHGLHVTHPL